MPPEKLVFGLGTYGRTFRLAPGQQGDQPGSLAQTGAPAGGECTLSPGVLSYYEIARKLGGQQVRGASWGKGQSSVGAWRVASDWLAGCLGKGERSYLVTSRGGRGE